MAAPKLHTQAPNLRLGLDGPTNHNSSFDAYAPLLVSLTAKLHSSRHVIIGCLHKSYTLIRQAKCYDENWS